MQKGAWSRPHLTNSLKMSPSSCACRGCGTNTADSSCAWQRLHICPARSLSCLQPRAPAILQIQGKDNVQNGQRACKLDACAWDAGWDKGELLLAAAGDQERVHGAAHGLPRLGLERAPLHAAQHAREQRRDRCTPGVRAFQGGAVQHG